MYHAEQCSLLASNSPEAQPERKSIWSSAAAMKDKRSMRNLPKSRCSAFRRAESILEPFSYFYLYPTEPAMRPAPYKPADAELDRLYQQLSTYRAFAYLGWFGLVCSVVSHFFK